MAKDEPRRIETTADADDYLDYALKHGVTKVRAKDDECVVEHVYGGVPDAILKKEASEAMVKKIRGRLTKLEELLAKFEEPDLYQ